MTKVLDQLPVEQLERMLCCYVNNTGKVQVTRITNIPGWYFERVVFPGENLLFEAPPTAELEIYQSTDPSNISVDRINCDSLQVIQENQLTIDN